MAWISFGALPCKGGAGGTWWQLASRYCWNRARPWHPSELVFFLVGLRTHQHACSVALLIFNLDIRWRRVVSVTPRHSGGKGFLYIRIRGLLVSITSLDPLDSWEIFCVYRESYHNSSFLMAVACSLVTLLTTLSWHLLSHYARKKISYVEQLVFKRTSFLIL